MPGTPPASRDFPPFPLKSENRWSTEFRRAVTVGLAAVSRVPGPKNSRSSSSPAARCSNSAATAAGRRAPVHDRHQRLADEQFSERGVRPLKTQQKISGRLTSDDVTQDRLDIRSYIDTARKHGLGAYDVLHQLMLGNPWLPPAQPISP